MLGRPFCPSASLCPPGCSPKTCGCPNHILLGSVVTPSGRPLPGAKVSLRDWPGTVATSDAHGTFRMPGVCASSQTNVSAQMDGFSAGTAQAQANSSLSAVVTIVLEKLGKCLVARGVMKLEVLGDSKSLGLGRCDKSRFLGKGVRCDTVIGGGVRQSCREALRWGIMLSRDGGSEGEGGPYSWEVSLGGVGMGQCPDLCPQRSPTW